MRKATCNHCAETFLAKAANRKYCSDGCSRAAAHEREKVSLLCVQCGREWRARRTEAKLCSPECRSQYYREQGFKPKRTPKAVCVLPSDHPVRAMIRARAVNLSPFRAAYEAGDGAGVIAAARLSSTVVNGCWIWSRRLRDGYPHTRIGKRDVPVHRAVLEAKHNASLGKQAAHHMCGHSACVNPDHLQPVTARENTAEMLARTYMVQRIADLEKALSEHDPDHPLLAEIGISVALAG